MSTAPGFDEVVTGRRSIRGFLDKPVPKALIAEVIEVAMRAPSSFNNQCWNFSVVTGAALDAIRQACLLRFRPIMMTTMAALFGALPLALGHGPDHRRAAL